ncbi:hypothetical protein [Pseudochrobactrum kiredjianiae]|uniref:Uncharacterized protein n=1 Tax=Pseudochrobactrum kiredjianiae TaxID=386305 RepID=A0ABW3V820_9HYPH|nr:hypothetical protein [Pseudochrobactrum kiredjianiae]MDM7850578.1 hypothetical protein [Pseudochrobactrum kiredjianiae]
MPSANVKLQPRLNKTTLISLAIGLLILVVSYPLALILPSWVSWENGPVENAQAAVLFFGMLQALIFQKYGSPDWKWLWRGAALIWFICAMRELSWGATLLDPIGMSEEGPFFSSRQLWYKPAIMPALITSILLMVVLMLKNGSQTLLNPLQRSGGLPWIEFLLATLCMMISTAAEEHLGLTTGLTGAAAQNLEELSELAAYIFLLTGQLRIRYHQSVLMSGN